MEYRASLDTSKPRRATRKSLATFFLMKIFWFALVTSKKRVSVRFRCFFKYSFRMSFEEFIKADEEYKETKEIITASLCESDIPRISLDVIGSLRSKLDLASARLMNSAMELARSEMLEAKEAAAGTTRIELKINNSSSSRSSELAHSESLKELEVAQQVTELIRRLVQENKKLSSKFKQFSGNTELMRRDLVSTRSFVEASESLHRDTQGMEFKIEAHLGRLADIRNEMVSLEKSFEATRQERIKSLEEQSRLDASNAQLEAMVEKLEDQLYLIELEASRDQKLMEQLVRKREIVQSEIQELEHFPAADIDDRFASPTYRAETLKAIDAERRRISTEVERIRESQFRARVKY